MNQTAKSQQWHFDMTAHVDVHSRTKLVHAVVAWRRKCTTARCCRICCRAGRRGYGAQAYQGQSTIIHARAPKAKHFTNRRYRCHSRID
jgi:IS5 family transposase